MITRLVPVFIIIIAIAMFLGYVNPTYKDKIVPLQAQIKQYNSTLAAAEDFNKKEAQLATERNAIPSDAIVRVQTYLPDGVDNVQLILDLNALAAKSGIQLSNFDIKDSSATASGQSAPDSSNQTVDSLNLTVKAIGTYSAFRTFLSGVEMSLRPMDLVQMDVTDSSTGVYTYDLTFRIYWLH